MPFVFLLFMFLLCCQKIPFSLWLLSIESQTSVLKKVPNVQGRHGHLGRVPPLTRGPITFALPVVQLSPHVLICRGKGVSRQSGPHSSTFLPGQAPPNQKVLVAFCQDFLHLLPKMLHCFLTKKRCYLVFVTSLKLVLSTLCFMGNSSKFEAWHRHASLSQCWQSFMLLSLSGTISDRYSYCFLCLSFPEHCFGIMSPIIHVCPHCFLLSMANKWKYKWFAF